MAVVADAVSAAGPSDSCTARDCDSDCACAFGFHNWETRSATPANPDSLGTAFCCGTGAATGDGGVVCSASLCASFEDLGGDSFFAACHSRSFESVPPGWGRFGGDLSGCAPDTVRPVTTASTAAVAIESTRNDGACRPPESGRLRRFRVR